MATYADGTKEYTLFSTRWVSSITIPASTYVVIEGSNLFSTNSIEIT